MRLYPSRHPHLPTFTSPIPPASPLLPTLSFLLYRIPLSSALASLPSERTRLTLPLSEDTLRVELQAETPNWILSSFGAGKYEPNLFFGYDTSPEELRWKSVQALNENRAQDYVCSLSLNSSQADGTR